MNSGSNPEETDSPIKPTPGGWGGGGGAFKKKMVNGFLRVTTSRTAPISVQVSIGESLGCRNTSCQRLPHKMSHLPRGRDTPHMAL